MTIRSISEGAPSKPVVVHKVGNFYLIEDQLMILAQVETHKVALISINDANRWSCPFTIDSPSSIATREMEYIVGSEHIEALVHVAAVDVKYSL